MVYGGILIVLGIMLLVGSTPGLLQRPMALVPTTETLHMWTTKHTVNTLNKNKLLTTLDTAGAGVGVSGSAGTTFSWGSLISIVHVDGTLVSVVAGTPVAQVSRSTGTGFQTATWVCPETSLVLTDAVLVQVYIKVGGGSWNLLVDFITEQLNADALSSATWSFIYNTAIVVIGSSATAQLMIGGYDSRIEGFTVQSEVTVQYTLTVEPSIGGSVMPATMTYDEGTHVNVWAIPSEGYVFDYWLLDGSRWGTTMACDNFVVMDSDHTLRAVFSPFSLPSTGIVAMTYTEYMGKSSSVSYADIRDSSTGWLESHRTEPPGDWWSWLIVGQHHRYDYDLTWWCMDRTYLFFDTSTVHVPDTITRGVVALTVMWHPMVWPFGNYEFDVVVQRPINTEYPHTPLIEIDWDRTKYTGNLGQLNTGQMPTTSTIYIELNSEGIAAINKGGITKFVLRDSYEINGIFEDGQQIQFYSPRISDESKHPMLYLDVVPAIPTYTLTITSVSGGTTSPLAGTYTYAEGTSQIVFAVADLGYEFSSWVLDGEAFTTNPITVIMDTSHSLTPVFAESPLPNKHRLTIVSNIGGITSPSGTIDYTEGTNVSVLATANIGFVFNYWLLDGVSHEENPILVTMDADHMLLAQFSEGDIIPPPPTEGFKLLPLQFIGLLCLGSGGLLTAYDYRKFKKVK